jgi:hypothetical protein
MQECWYYNKHGEWQNPQNSVDQLKGDCEKVYNVSLKPPLYAPEAPPADYVAPDTLSGIDICGGQYDPTLVALNQWGTGNVGQCWEPDYSVAQIDNPCDGADTPTTRLSAAVNADGNYYYCDAATVWTECIDNYKPANGKCLGGDGWQAEQIDDPAAVAGVATLVGWTNDDDPDDNDSDGFDGAETCIDNVLKNYCGSMESPTIVDASGSLNTSGAAWVLPAILVASAVDSQLGEPLQIGADQAMMGRIKTSRVPSGIIQEFQYNLRIGTMIFNNGSASECKAIPATGDVDGDYIASLYDCLEHKDNDITSASVPATTIPQRDGGHILTYIGQGEDHVIKLVDELNGIEATTWTPTVEALYNALGYFTQQNNDSIIGELRIHPDDFIWDHDSVGTLWKDGEDYERNDIVYYPVGAGAKRYFTLSKGTSRTPDGTGGLKEDEGVDWQAYDPVIADCQTNNILLISDGASTADVNRKVIKFIQEKANDGNLLNPDKTWASGETESDGDTFVTAVGDPTDYECRAANGDRTLYGNSALDDIVAYAGSSADIFLVPSIDGFKDKNTIDIHIVVAGDLPAAPGVCSDSSSLTMEECEAAERTPGNWIAGTCSDASYLTQALCEAAATPGIWSAGTCSDPPYLTKEVCESPYEYWIPDGLECDVSYLLSQAEEEGAFLHNDINLSVLESTLRSTFEGIGGEVSSGAAASVISHSRSGDGAIYQAIFYPLQTDDYGNKVAWTGDIHSLWLDDNGNIHEDCGPDCDDGTPGDGILNMDVDPIIEFYSDPNERSARVRRYMDVDGDGKIDKGHCDAVGTEDFTRDQCAAVSGTWVESVDMLKDGIILQKLKYIWSAGQWLATGVQPSDAPLQRSYSVAEGKRYIFTSTNGRDVVDFTTTALADALSDKEYLAYLNPDYPVAATDAQKTAAANKIVNYVRGQEQTGFRSREIDWDKDDHEEIYKLGDIIHSTPTLVGAPAENYDLIYADTSYQKFRRKYRDRRLVVYAGGNDGGLHAFNGGYYLQQENQFLPAPPNLPVPSNITVDDPITYTKSKHKLGAELWMYIPRSALPHLKWMTGVDYEHVYYVDLKPYIFDAKIFNPSDDRHPGGWGTVLVGGMRFGGGDIDIDLDGDGVLDPETLRSTYFALDITDPEAPPVLLGEFSAPDLGYSLASPTAIPLLRCDKTTVAGLDDCNDKEWPMDWYLAIGSGPKGTSPRKGMLGRSDQRARVFILKLGGSTSDAAVAPTGLPYASVGISPAVVNSGVMTLARAPITIDPGDKDSSPIGFNNSFFSNMITVDYDFSFQADALYFGSVSQAGSAQLDHNQHRGGLHRLVIDDGVWDELDPANWKLNTMFYTGQPVTAAPAVAFDGKRAWVYFGTGRFLDAASDKKMFTRQSFYGLKEIYNDTDGMELSWGYDDGTRAKANLVDVTDVQVTDQTGNFTLVNPTLKDTNDVDVVSGMDDVTTFRLLNTAMSSKDGDDLDVYNGWKINFGESTSLFKGERNIGQAAILGDIVTFTSYVPSVDKCDTEGESYLWAPHYRTGTAFYRSIIGLDTDGTTVLRKLSLGKGLATTPNIHTGAEAGSKAFVQTSTGAIIGLEQTNPGVIKSGIISWRELNNE